MEISRPFLDALSPVKDGVLARDSHERYLTTLASTPAEVAEAQALRFEVFNVELAEGLVSSFITGRDEDPFDAVCQHLLVREFATGKVVGTYRFQTGATAAANLGYYSESEFDLTPLESRRHEVLELGRACVHKEHRNLRALSALWRGISVVVALTNARFLMGCSSLNTTDKAAGLALYQQLAIKHLAPPEFRTVPQPSAACVTDELLPLPPKPPKLLAAYLSLGAWITGEPAVDRDFGTIDFFTVLDMQRLNPDAARLYLGSQWKPPSAASFV